MRLRNRPWVKDEIMQQKLYIVPSPEEYKGKWNTLFQNSNPIHIEIGTGKGNFITTLAKQNTDINYIALEQKPEVLVQAIRKAKELGLSNIKFILGDANLILDFFGENELSRIYLNFSDPWPKNRHAKRRLTYHRFLTMYKEILINAGEIHLKTDNEFLFEFSLNEFIRNNYKLHNISLNLYRDEENIKQHIKTEYETKFVELGKPIYRVEAKLGE